MCDSKGSLIGVCSAGVLLDYQFFCGGGEGNGDVVFTIPALMMLMDGLQARSQAGNMG